MLFKIFTAKIEAVITVEGKTTLLLSFSDLGLIGPSDSNKVYNSCIVPMKSVCSITNKMLSEILYVLI